MKTIPEHDWKVLRELVEIALERYCRGVLEEAAPLVNAPADGEDGYHERYLALFKLLRDRDNDLAKVFNDLKRSTALHQLTFMRQLGLLTEEEFAQFSPETRKDVQAFLTA